MNFKFGSSTPSRIVKFRRIEYTRTTGDGQSTTTLLSTRYAMNAREKARAQRKADEINNRWDKSHPSYRKPSYPNRHRTVINESARVVVKAEDVGNAIPVYV